MRTGMRTAALVLALALAAVLAGCSGAGEGDGTADGSSGSTGTTITESGSAFEPAFLSVGAGATVTFTNEDAAEHQVLIDGITLDRQAQGESVTWTAATAGTYDYICTVHPSMMGRIEVK